MKIGFRPTKDNHLGKWEAQVAGLPQARCYGASPEEAVGKLILAFGKEHGVTFIYRSEMQDQRAPRSKPASQDQRRHEEDNQS